MEIARRSALSAYVTRDGSEIREPVAVGDCIVIPPGTVHRLWADATAPLVVVCSCVPPYSHADTVLV